MKIVGSSANEGNKDLPTAIQRFKTFQSQYKPPA